LPPVQSSLRGSLLTGVSVAALSVASTVAHGQAAQQGPPPNLAIWAEGALFWTGGGSFNVPTIPGFSAPYTSFNPKVGLEGAVGFDYRWPDQPWHFVFDFRYGRTRTSTKNSSAFRSFITFPFGTSGFPFLNTATSTSIATHHESHLVADFMIGRDFGVGSNKPELLFGIRIADLRATVHVEESGQFTFYSSSGVGIGTQTATGNWHGRFFGVGPRLAVVGGIPISGLWSFDYGAGIAALFGDRKLDVNVTNSAGPSLAASNRNSAVVFNADGSLALSYLFTPQFKMSAGIRGDFYNAALTTYDINTGALETVSRLYWGPFVRLTGSF
jgi:hypothetical protein